MREEKKKRAFYLMISGRIEAEIDTPLEALLDHVDSLHDPEERLRGLGVVVDAFPELRVRFSEMTGENASEGILVGDFGEPTTSV